MPLTEEQEQSLELAAKQNELSYNLQANVELLRNTHVLELDNRHTRLEAVRLAKETLIESARSKPVDQREIDANTIVSFAEILVNYVDQNQ